MSERALGVELGEQGPQLLVARRVLIGNFVFLQGRDDAVAGKHGGSLDHGGRADAIHPDLRRQRNSQLTKIRVNGISPATVIKGSGLMPFTRIFGDSEIASSRTRWL